MEEMVRDVVFMLALAFGGEGIIEFLVSPLMDAFGPSKEEYRTVVFNILSAILGVVLAAGFEVSIARVFNAVPANPYIDTAFTGLLLGRGFNWMHGFFKQFAVQIGKKFTPA